MSVTKLLISPVKIRILRPRTTKFGSKLAFLPGLAGSIGALLVGWLVVVARVTVSRKTPIYFILLNMLGVFWGAISSPEDTEVLSLPAIAQGEVRWPDSIEQRFDSQKS